MRHEQSLIADLIKGAVAGAVATYVMSQATTALYEREPSEAREREEEARGGQSAYANAADLIAGRAGVELSDEGRSRGASAIHWALGVAAGMKYAVLRRYWPGIRAGFGLPYGAAFFLTMDELMVPALGLTPGPTAFPWQTHARGLAGHLAFGAVNDCTLRALDRAA